MALQTSIDLRVVPANRFSETAADLVAETLRQQADAVVGLPTGNTPMPLYHELVRRCQRGTIDFSKMRVAVLDDFYGIPANSPISFYGWLCRALLDPLGISSERVLRIPTEGPGIERKCAEYERALKEMGGCELQVLGLGGNGHVGFNEPGSARDSRTRVVKLSAASRAASSAYWNGADVPDQGVTTGIGTILEARRILLLVSGARKAEILRRSLTGPISSDVPASFLREAANAVVIADEPAASLLER